MTHMSSEDSGSACILAQSDKSQMFPEETLGSCLPIESPANTDLTARMCIFLSENMSSCKFCWSQPQLLFFYSITFNRGKSDNQPKQTTSKYNIYLANHLRTSNLNRQMDRVKRIWYLSPMRAAKVQASLRIRAVSPEPSLLAHTSSESRGTFRQKARSQAPLNDWTCAVTICHDGMLEDTNWLDGAHMYNFNVNEEIFWHCTTEKIAQFSVTKPIYA